MGALPSARSAGFTLIEIIVALLVSSLVLVGLNQAMTSIRRGSLAARQTLAGQASFATALRVVAGDLSRIERVTDSALEPTRFEFAGLSTEMRYILAERPQHNRAGLYWARLAVRRASSGMELARARAPYVPGAPGPGPAEWQDEVVLLSGRFDFRFAYRAPDAGMRAWASAWQPLNLLPGQIKLEITDLDTGRLKVPVFVETLKIDAEAACAAKGTTGCTLKSNGILQ